MFKVFSETNQRETNNINGLAKTDLGIWFQRK
jgi:hypothetical protein